MTDASVTPPHMPVFVLADPRPHPALVGADWGDAYGVEVAQRLTARQALDRLLEATPRWITDLLALRNRVTALVGLKSARMDVGEGGFPVLSQTDTEMVLGLDDRHLDFRLVVVHLHCRILTLWVGSSEASGVW